LQKRVGALLITPDNLFAARRVQIITLAARHAVPVMHPGRADVEAGGLMRYGTVENDLSFRQLGLYTGRILKGEKPADLPVMRAARFAFIINRQTVRTLGLTVPPGLLAHHRYHRDQRSVESILW